MEQWGEKEERVGKRRGAEDSLLISTSKSHFNSTNTERSNSSSSSSQYCDTKFIFFHCFHSNFALCLIADVHIQIHAAPPPLSLCLLTLTHALLRVTQDEQGFAKMQGTFTSHPPFHPQPGWPHQHVQVAFGGKSLGRAFLLSPAQSGTEQSCTALPQCLLLAGHCKAGLALKHGKLPNFLHNALSMHESKSGHCSRPRELPSP